MRLQLTLIITREIVDTLRTDLSTWMWPILKSKTHTRHIYQLDLIDQLHEIPWKWRHEPSWTRNEGITDLE